MGKAHFEVIDNVTLISDLIKYGAASGLKLVVGEMETGDVRVEKVGGKSTVTRCFCRYPLKFIIPRKAGSVKTDSVWIYSLTYGGGIVSGDAISCGLYVGDGCTTVLTTQASTKVYKSLGSKCSEQLLEAEIGSEAILVVIPDPVTCFSTARYSQKQVFRVVSDSSLVLVDWITSGRHESGEIWDFDLYRSTNNIFLGDGQPLFLDTVEFWSGLKQSNILMLFNRSWLIENLPCKFKIFPVFAISLNLNGNRQQVLLEKGAIAPLAESMQTYRVIAMIVIFGTKLGHIQKRIQEDVKRMMSEQIQVSSNSFSHKKKPNSLYISPDKLSFIASCSSFGQKEVGLVVRIASRTTESVYSFLRGQLAGLEPLIGLPPYC
ncbi:hypothetical protein SAY87_022394 [Trapa incisa]|uniref:Urease accessory protein D n=1 Tax=Trapa incisa TaxID=236973 RepID=A0AAN7K7Q4_9MYRT|nr:hypothetical protein SAY87_022394 [Trapa incisa]